jgi:four helix bundle protein
MVKTFKDLIVWQKAHQMMLKAYKYTENFPASEKYGLTSDFRRAARSVPTNIVEGYKRKGYKDALNFFNISDASLKEVEYHALVARDLSYLAEDKFMDLINLIAEVGRLLNGWQKSYRPKNLQHCSTEKH